jgi:hypothetical protein
MEVLDILGKPIKVGDTVVFGLGQTYTLRKAKVLKITEKVVILDYKANTCSWSKNVQRPFDDVVVVEKANDN